MSHTPPEPPPDRLLCSPSTGIPVTPSGPLRGTISHALDPKAPSPTGAEPGGAPPAIEGYEILGVLGRGGMGVVYKARQLALNRTVALKMILAGGHAGPEQQARFRREAQAVARLQHPHIVQIHEVGEADGCAFFSLEHVAGGSLAQKLAGMPQPPVAAACLVRTLAEALHHAHERGVVHRDLKPSNILLTPDGAPIITDFGLAGRLESGPGLTATGAILGTPSYMAPEQAEGQKDIGAAADIYALGAILYECLTGRPPFLAATALETLHQVLAQEPVSLRRLQPGTPRDLEIICLQCLRKEPGRRYAAAGDLAEDLRRFEAGEPILARPAGTVEKVRKWVKRRPALAALLAVKAAFVLTLLGGGIYFTQELQAERDTAERQRDEARAQEQRAEGLRQRAEKGEAEAGQRLELAKRMLLTAQLWRVATLWERDPVEGLKRLEDPQRCPPHLRDFTWSFYHRLCHRLRQEFKGHEGPITSVAFTRDGHTLATASAGPKDWKAPRVGVVRLWDVATGRPRVTFTDPGGGFTSIALSPDGKTVATAGSDATVKLWDAGLGKERAVLRGHTGWVLAVAFSPDGRTLASAGSDKTVKLWDVEARKPRASLTGHGMQIQCVAFSPDGRTLASGGSGPKGAGEVRLWDVAAGKPRAVLQGHTGAVTSLAFAPDGRSLASGATDFTVRLWDLLALKERTVFRESPGAAIAVAFSPDGRTLVPGGLQGQLILWDVATGQDRTVLKGHTGHVSCVAFSPDGKFLASGSGQENAVFDVKLWDVIAGPEGATLQAEGDPVYALAYSGDGRTLAARDEEAVALWDVGTGRRRAALVGHRKQVQAIALSKDGQTLASSDWGNQVKVWDVAQRRARFTIPGRGALGLSADGKLLAVAGKDGTLRLWDTTTGKERAAWPGGFGGAALTADGTVLAAGKGGTLWLWDVATGRELGRVQGGHGVFSPDGRLLATTTGREILLWEVATRKKHATLKGHDGGVQGLAFSADGLTLASASSGPNEVTPGELKLWDVTTGEERAALRGHRWIVSAVAFAPDGRTLASGSWDGAIKLWYAAPYRAEK